MTGKCLTRSVTSSSWSGRCITGSSRPIRPSTWRGSRFSLGVEPAAVAVVGTLTAASAPGSSAHRRTRAGSGPERAALGRSTAREAASDLGQRCGPRLIEPGREPSSPRCTGAAGREDLVERPLLDHPAGVHHQHPVGDFGDDAQVVGDQDRRRCAPVSCSSSREDLCLIVRRARWSARRRSAPRFERQRHRDHCPLPHPARELVRVVVDAPLGVRGCRPLRASRSPGRALRPGTSSRARVSPRRSDRRSARPG